MCIRDRYMGTLGQTLALVIGTKGIHFTSKPGKGSRFFFDLPMGKHDRMLNSETTGGKRTAPPAEESCPSILILDEEDIARHDVRESVSIRRPQELQVQTVERCSCRRILVVDDNAYNMFMMKRKLLPRGYEVIEAQNGALALETLERLFQEPPRCAFANCSRVSMVFMDIDMPVLNGLDATSAIRRRVKDNQWPAVPVVGCSAFDTEADVRSALSVGMSDYLSKPVEDSNLDEVLRRFAPKVN
eukprot:TRINITY_DN5110_c0_g2_i1.p1 TRINITY_DN5110_c0_g2~~TRINITY_DN5110_c0_g2_i1.p1  ORF type:complete len:244 (+),score=39.18 TRINITY_DN5110_c0_g2_i1:66-797(+)